MVHQVEKWRYLRPPNCEIAIKSSRNCEQFGMIGVSVILHCLSHVRLFVTPWAAAFQASLSFTISWSLLKLMSIESMIPSNHLRLQYRDMKEKYWETKLNDWGGMSPLGRQWRDLSSSFPLLRFYQSHPSSRKPSTILHIFPISFEMHSIQSSGAQCWGVILGSKSQESQGRVDTGLLSPLE